MFGILFGSQGGLARVEPSTESRGLECYSKSLGGVNLAPNGNWWAHFGRVDYDCSRLIELDRESKELVFEMRVEKKSYRSMLLPLHPRSWRRPFPAEN